MHNKPTLWARLRSLIGRLRAPSRLAAGSKVAVCTQIGIKGLPDGVNQMPRHMPVSLVTADDSSAALWLPALLEDAVAAGPVALVASSTEWADGLLLRQPLRDAYRRGQLMLWVLSPGLQTEVKRPGLGLLMSELARTGLREQHALYICDAQPLLSGLSVAQLARVSRQLSQLCQARRRPVVLGFLAHPALDVLLPTLRNLGNMPTCAAACKTCTATCAIYDAPCATCGAYGATCGITYATCSATCATRGATCATCSTTCSATCGATCATYGI